MYVELLTRALDEAPASPRSEDALLADVVVSRAQLQAAEEVGVLSPVEVLARELSYDGALIRFCESLEVPTDLRRFSSPAEERARLEHELAERGYALIDR
jgi:hypothetical protein